MSANKVDSSSISNALVQSTSKRTGELEGNIQELFNLQLKQVTTEEYLTSPDGPFLERFINDGLIPKEFKFDESQENFIKGLFQKWSLHNELCLLDLLGVDIFQSINLMKTTLTQDTKLEFCSCLYILYLNLKRHKEQYPPLEKMLDDYHYKGTNWFVLSLDTVKKQMKEAIDIKLIQIDENRKITHETKATLRSKVSTQFDEFDQSIELLKFIIKLKFSSALLMDYRLMSFKGSGALKKDPKTTLSHLRIYIDYTNNIYLSGLAKKRCVVAGLDLNFLNLDVPRKELPQLVDSCKEKMRFLSHTFGNLMMDYQYAVTGQLTHAEWLRSKGARQVTKKDHAEFTEILFQQALFLHLMGDFVGDFQKMIDEIILPGYFNSWPKQDSILMRFWVNLGMVSDDFAQTSPTTEIHSLIRSKLFDEFQHLVNPLETFYKRNNLSAMALSHEDLKEKIQARKASSDASVVLRVLHKDPSIPNPEYDVTHVLQSNADNRPSTSKVANQPSKADNRPSSSYQADQPSNAHNRPSSSYQADQPSNAHNRPFSSYEANIPLRGYNQPSSSSDRSNTQKINVIPFTNIPLPTLMEMNPLILSFEEKMNRLPLVLESLRLEFKSLLSTLPQEQRNIDFFRKCCFDECIRYCRMAFIFNDYRAKTDKIFWLEEFPEQLADFIQLEGLDDIFTTESFIEQFKELEIEPQSVLESPKEPSQSVESPKESSQTIAEPTKTRPAELPKGETLKPVDTKFQPFELKSKNVRKVIRKLTDAGFFLARQKGSHQIFKLHENGPQVVVPNHDELKTGTLASIQDQANFALNSTL